MAKQTMKRQMKRARNKSMRQDTANSAPINRRPKPSSNSVGVTKAPINKRPAPSRAPSNTKKTRGTAPSFAPASGKPAPVNKRPAPSRAPSRKPMK